METQETVYVRERVINATAKSSDRTLEEQARGETTHPFDDTRSFLVRIHPPALK